MISLVGRSIIGRLFRLATTAFFRSVTDLNSFPTDVCSRPGQTDYTSNHPMPHLEFTMTKSSAEVLKIGDVIEFQRGGNPKPVPEWHPQRVTDIRICEEYEDKEGVEAQEVSWFAIREFQCLVVIAGTENWGRNHQIRRIGERYDGEVFPFSSSKAHLR